MHNPHPRPLRPPRFLRFAALLRSLAVLLLAAAPPAGACAAERLRLIVETDAGGDPDDEQSLVRFLLYAGEWDVEGIIATRPTAREGENKNPVRTGLGIVQQQIEAYEACYPQLVQHDKQFPPPAELRQKTVAGYGDAEDGVQLILSALDRDDPRPVWFLNWGTDNGSAESSLKQALDQVLAERGPEGYAKFKRKLRLSSADKFGDHTTRLAPPFPIWVDTFRPERNRKRWYHRFSELTATAGGFDLERDVRTGHGPLGALYPTNTTHKQKEGDSPTFIYLIPTGLGDPEHPGWGGWPGRYGPHDEFPGKPYYWANVEDTWEGKTSRDNTLARWAAALQNDFRARMDWCVCDFDEANHPPQVRVAGDRHVERERVERGRESIAAAANHKGSADVAIDSRPPLRLAIEPGQRIELDASPSTDPDGDELDYAWCFYPESTGYQGELPQIEGSATSRASFAAPKLEQPTELHLIVAVTDRGEPPLTRYQRIALSLSPTSP